MNTMFTTLLAATAAKKPYKQTLSYLASTQTQWIDTGVVAKTTTRADVDFGIGLVARGYAFGGGGTTRSEEHTSELQSQ